VSVLYRNIEVEQIEDDCPDVSYLTQDEFSNRLGEYQKGNFFFVGVRAQCEVLIPMGENTFVTLKLTSPGIWGIESDSSDEYLHEVAEDEKAVLLEMLSKLGASPEPVPTC